MTPQILTHPGPAARPTHARLRALVRGRADDAPYVRPALLGLLVLTTLLYVWSLSGSGWANSFYAAAVQAGSESWKAFFFGSSDAANSITVDKTPLSLWPMALSARIFGLSSFSMLAPQALMGAGSVALLYLSVRRATGQASAGLLAGSVLALTPVAVLMFGFNNPDALLVLLMIGSLYATQRALAEPGRAVRWLVLGGSLVGLAFLTKMLQAFLVLPPLALMYAWSARVPVVQRLRHLLIAFGSMLVAGGWWVAIVEAWPASSRPYIGGSQHNSVLELTLGYNGLGRLNGNETGSVGGGGGWGETGLWRMLNSEIGGQIGWLLPTAVVLTAVSAWFLRRAARTDALTAAVVGWGGWLVVTALTFSYMAGIFHAYYTVALAPAIAAMVALGTTVLWRHRTEPAALLAAAFTVALTGAVAFMLLDRTPAFVPWLRWVVIITGAVAASGLALHAVLPRRGVIAVAIATLIATMAGPAAYAVETASMPHTGSIPSAGPSSGGGFGGPGGGGGGGLLNGSRSTTTLDQLLAQDADSYTWVAAAIGSNSASGYQLSTGLPVMAIGGFNGSDPSPTLAQFRQYVEEGRIHWFIGGGRGGGPSAGGGTSGQISAWVQENFQARSVDGVTVYDLSAGTTEAASA